LSPGSHQLKLNSMNVRRWLAAAAALALLPLAMTACKAEESHRTLPTQTVSSYGTAYNGPRPKLAIGQVHNRSPYGQGIFSDGKDRLGIQATQILTSHVTQSNRFILLDRANLAELEREAGFSGESQAVQGAK